METLKGMKSLFFSKKYKIVIDKPCQESWGKMHAAPNGRFCDSCSKSVVDFTNMSEREINERMRNSGAHMCGRFRNDQLDRVYTLQPKIQLSAQRRFFQYLLTFLLGSKAFSSKVAAQTDTLKIEQTDSLKLAVHPDSTLADTVALAIADTNKINLDSLWVNYEWPEIIFTDTMHFEMLTTSGFCTMPSVETSYDWLLGNNIFPLLPAAFDSIKRVVGIKTKAPEEKVVTLKEDPLPKKKTPLPPVKDEEPIVAVLPEGLKMRSEEV